MAGQTKMIIITSDQDIIRQFSLNKTINTHIIDLDHNKQLTSTAKHNNNITDLAFFAGLSELNSSSDQIYKRALDSPGHNPPKAAKVSRKKIDLICRICGDHAVGFNYDVLSCASCKAFFRRNANQQPEKITCLTGQGQCSVAHETRRKCPKCRLDRCLAMGMRKDFILSEGEKQRRKTRLEENRNMTSQRLSITSDSATLLSTSNLSSNSESLSPTYDEIDRLLLDMNKDNDNNILHESSDSYEMEETLFETFSVGDWMTIQNVRSSFLSVFQRQNIACPFNDVSDHASAFISWSKMANQAALSFISFFRTLDEFDGLHADDRFILIKYNLLPLFPIFKCFNYNPLNDCCSHGDNEEAQQNRRFFMSCDQSMDIRNTFVNLVLSLVEVTEQDSTILSLLLVILIFSQGLSMNEDEPPLKDPLVVNRAQLHYTKLLWHCLVNKWNEVEASKRFTQLFFIIIRIQSLAKKYRDFGRLQFMKTDTVDRIAPLMQTILHIS